LIDHAVEVRRAALALMDAADLLEEGQWDEARERIQRVVAELFKVVRPDEKPPWL
jgi:hypothetical protein